MAGIPGSEQLTTIHRDTRRDTQAQTDTETEKHVLFGMNQRGQSLFPLFIFPIWKAVLQSSIRQTKEDMVKKEQNIRRGV